MPDFNQFQFSKYTDGTIRVGIVPPTAIGGWDLRFQLKKEFDGYSGLVNKYVGSGLDGTSGISIVSSGNGTLDISITRADTSGLPYGVYAFTVDRTSSGYFTPLSIGQVILTP